MQSDIGTVCRHHLEFMKWADEIVLSALAQVPEGRISQDMGNSFQSMLGTLGHIYLADAVWITRVKGRGDAMIAEFTSPGDLEGLTASLSAMHREWLEWAAGYSTGDWNGLCACRSPQGKDYQMPYWQIVLHVVNHASYHRGQLATMLRQSGLKPPATDLIAYYRTL